MGAIANLFGYLLNFLYNIFNNYGIAIIVFSVILRIILIPVTISQQKSIKKNEKMQEKMKEIQRKYKNNPEKLNQETMDLYKREKLNPFSGCLSSILQIIIILSVFWLVSKPLTYMKKVDTNIINGYVEEITDHLPDQLEFVAGNETNSKYGWVVDSTNSKIIRTNYLSKAKEASEGANKIKAFDGTKLDYKDVKVVCKVVSTDPMPTKITNIADITKFTDGNGNTVTDRDSQENNVNIPSDLPGYKDDEIGKDYVPGQQDDDDFEKVKVNKIVDLALKKSIISIGDTNYKRLGEIDVTPLKQGETTANYHINKYVLYATQGDIVTYRIYIFNEGSVDATASEIKDYLPEELEFLPDDELNKSYGWTAETNNETKITTLTTTYLKNRFIDKYTKQMQEYDVDPNCAFVDVRCKVKDDAKPDKRLVNIAEINEYQTSGATLTKDVDSGTKQNGSVKLPTIAAWENYVTKYNINDMDKNGYYVFYGQEDDDDYDSLTVRKNKQV